jgi:FkbM family methyltransferase
MNTYSQNAEDIFILNHFGSYKGTLLEIGSNDGRTLSNSLAFIDNGWQAHLIEPGHTFQLLQQLHENNPRVSCHNFAIGGKFVDSMTFYESGAHVIGGSDTGLVSTLDFEETERWRRQGVEFTERKVSVHPFSHLWDLMGKCTIDYISIDAEGFDFDILQQINLTEVGCKALVIEHNAIIDLANAMVEYCFKHGLSLAHQNNENLIFVK